MSISTRKRPALKTCSDEAAVKLTHTVKALIIAMARLRQLVYKCKLLIPNSAPGQLGGPSPASLLGRKSRNEMHI